MATKQFFYSQFADLRIEGIGINASFSVTLTINDENTTKGKNITVIATGKSQAAKAAGSGKLIFWCKVKNSINNQVHVLERRRGEHYAVSLADSAIGSTTFFLPDPTFFSPSLEIEAGYFYDSGYSGAVAPVPSSLKRVIHLTPFKK